MKRPELVLLMLFIALIGKSTFAQNSPFKLDGNEHQLSKIDESYSVSTEIKPFNGQGKKIYGLAASAEIDFTSANGVVRLVLLDNNFNEYLLLESYPSIDGIKATFEGHAEETALLDGITPYAIEIEVKDASIHLQQLSYATKGDVISDYNKQKKEKQSAQNSDKIKRLNQNLKANGQHWVASETSVSQLNYGQRKKLYGSSTFPAGFEFYAGGVISTSASEEESSTGLKSATTSSPYINEWDWRDRHGKNWISPVKNQSSCGSCWAFATAGATEAMVNVFYNQQINLDLSEQELISCSGAGSCLGGSPKDALDYIISNGIIDEATFPYQKADISCENKGTNPSELIKIGGKIGFNGYTGTEDDLKKLLIDKGPLSGGLADWSHAMVLVGYKVVEEGDIFYYRDLSLARYWIEVQAGDPLIGKTVWIFKNSWGEYSGDYGYVYVETNMSNIAGTYAITTPITSSVNNYEVQCTDADGDGYYWWGLGEKPANCPPCPDLADGDDTDPTKGPLDEYGYCTPLGGAPIADFTSTSTTVNKGQSVSFTDLTTNAPTSWSWTFEGGTPSTSTEQHPTVAYTTTGNFSVSLTVNNAEGSDTKSVTSFITVTEPVSAPVASFSATPATINEGSEVSFTDLTTNDPTAWSWTFEGGTPATSEIQNPKVVYSTPGTYNVTLAVTNSGGTNTKTITNCIQVVDTVEAPVAAFTTDNTTISEGQSVTFTDQSTNTPTSWSWTFEGGATASSTEQNPTVVYATPGEYSVTLIATNDGGSNSVTKSAFITVQDTLEAPVADFSADNTSVLEGSEISFTDKSTNTPASWKWVFEGGSPSISTEKNPKVTYNSSNSYKVSLTVTNAAGNHTKTVENYITVEALPEPDYCVPTPDATDEWIAEVHMGDNSYSSGSEGYADNTATSFNFTAGTNTSFNLVPGFSGRSSFEYWGIWIDFNSDMNFTEDEKVFTSSKSKSSVSGTIYIPQTTVTTRMRIAMGSSSPTACDFTGSGEVEDYTIVISEPVSLPPVADFSASSTSIGAGQTVQFTNISANEPTSYQWYFPGGTPSESTEANPTVTYATAGTYDVTLVANKTGFTSSEVTLTNYITVTEEEVTPTPSGYCEPSLISSTLYYIKNVNIGNELSVSSYGDGYSYDSNPFTLNAGGTYTVDLTPSKTTSRNFWRIWIDFNNDGDFDDADETVLALNNKKGSISASISIPTYVTETTRIRIAMKVGAAPASCDDDFMGEIEDYLVAFAPQMMQASNPQESYESLVEMNLKVYPNPTTDWLNLQLSDITEQASYEIYNTVGKKVAEELIDAPLTKINMSNKSPGIYVVVVKTESQTFNEKIIKR
ncbi:PKD domain-containing protein [Draconibacterium sp. IB214405]|uniref:PKD domain-containing protein n=1 Tax=Draconibacterium sp. IB214405 TaxID=3097352 RepID=UPI002A1432C8|nr:PKD domain-containing protein [Draconibacterium sp. IB214405]MDX8339535.1 PKD domain-containing protein [Draconibacterium sp. IB214405]